MEPPALDWTTKKLNSDTDRLRIKSYDYKYRRRAAVVNEILRKFVRHRSDIPEKSDLDDVAAFWETAISLPQLHRLTHFTLVEPHSFLGRHGHGPSRMAR